MKLISMTDYVLEQEINTPKAVNFASFTTIADYNKLAYDRVITYANFLKQPLTLETTMYCFKGFELKKGFVSYQEDWLDIDDEYCQNKTIEDLVIYNLTLTDNIINKLGL
jgi:hypothetical protein